MKQSDLKWMIEKARRASDSRAALLEGDDNPQVVELRVAAKARSEAFSAVLWALYGDPVPLRLFCE